MRRFNLPKWKTYFSQFTDKFLKIEEVGHLIQKHDQPDHHGQP